MSKKAMRLIDKYTSLLECKTCGHRHYGMLKPQSNGQFYRGTWQCSNQGCPTNVK